MIRRNADNTRHTESDFINFTGFQKKERKKNMFVMIIEERRDLCYIRQFIKE